MLKSGKKVLPVILRELKILKEANKNYLYLCMLAAMLCAGMWTHVDSMNAMLVGMAAVVLIRFLAAHYHWNLPKSKM